MIIYLLVALSCTNPAIKGTCVHMEPAAPAMVFNTQRECEDFATIAALHSLMAYDCERGIEH